MLEKVAFVKTLLPDIRNYILSHPIQNIEVKDNEFDNIVTDIDVTIQNRLEKALIERYPDTSLFGEEADEHLFTPKMWIMGDDRNSTPPLTYLANGGQLQYATFEQEGFEIVQGQGLDPDIITPEYGWIVAVVPSGAVSSMVKVVLED